MRTTAALNLLRTYVTQFGYANVSIIVRQAVSEGASTAGFPKERAPCFESFDHPLP